MPRRAELSLSAGCRQLEHRKGNLPSSVSRKLYFDTHALVCLLETNGFTTQQAEIIVSALVKSTETNMDIVYNDMVTKVQQEINLQQIMSQIANDEVIKVRTDTKLNFNLEKSRVKELYSLNEKKLLQLRTEMVSLHAQQDRALTQTDRKIETEVAGLKTMLEAHKLDTIKYLAGAPREASLLLQQLQRARRGRVELRLSRWQQVTDVLWVKPLLNAHAVPVPDL
ncbi:hypothetical protein A6R68_12989 [Neotoma lepida]|uniref:Mitochondrial calcium uniporter regulator 1 n=1 Tax=Neotoma lepida TaxID=56216 RepID=A0A1A6H246_NEOLE|nr:hypothetical protein A6R68_12989 [Neotoma lepida]